ncbi:MAG: alpha/beta hydrolase-fold protein [Planctomycetota bacterium]
MSPTTARSVLEELRQGRVELLDERDFPVVGNGWAVFAHRAQADAVHLHHWIYGLESSQPFERVGHDLWVLETEVQKRARVEYKLEVVHGDRHQLIRDPLNPHLAQDPFGANSVVHGIDYVDPEWAEEYPETRKGEIIERRLRSDTFGDVRPLSIYLPARFRETRRYPLLICHDGIDYQRFANLASVLDNLIERLEIPPIIVALTQSPNRIEEYAADDRHARFIAEELLPLLQNEFPLMDDPRDRGLIGASFGAVASLHTAHRYPGKFGKLLLQSGSFAFTDIGDHGRGPLFDPVVKFVNDFREDPGQRTEQIFLSCGVYESLIHYNRAMLPLLMDAGADVRLVEAQDGHNWENWRDRLREGLTWLFAGPLWMVYE